MDLTFDWMKDRLSHNNKPIVDILQNMLRFNCYFRMSAFELLRHSVFDRIRDKEKEMVLKRLRSSNNDITLRVDRDDAFDYENKWEKYQIPDLKRMLA